MKKKHDLEEHNRDLLKIDPLSKQKFVANTRRRIHLNQKNKNDWHNRQRRLKKEAEERKWRIEIPSMPKDEEKDIVKKKIEPVLVVQSPAPVSQTNFISPEVHLPIAEANAMLLAIRGKNNQLIHKYIGNKTEVKVNLNKMIADGFVFEAFNSRQQLPNSTEYLAIYGEFAVVWYNENEVLITYRNNYKWL